MCVGDGSTHCQKDFNAVSRFLEGEVDREIEQIICHAHTTPPPLTNAYQPGRRILDKIHKAQTERQAIELDSAELTDELFDFLWTAERAYPLVVHNADQHLQLNWDAPCFIDLFGEEKCIIEDCKTGQQCKSTVGQFFQKFGQDTPERDVVRVKVG